MMIDLDKLRDSLSPNERKILPYIRGMNLTEICKKSNLNKVAVVRSLEYLQNKGVVKLNYSKKKIIELGVNGILYKKKWLPERRLLNLLNEKRIVGLDEAQGQGKFSLDEFRVAVGALKKKAMIEIKNKKIILSVGKDEVIKKMLEEIFLELLPLDYNLLTPEQVHALKNLQDRKNIIEVKEDNLIDIEITELGGKIINSRVDDSNMIEEITSETLRNEKFWKGKKFRRYDITSNVPSIYSGKRHFVNQAIDYGRKIWTEMGFKEMTGNLIQSSFWNFDALFTAQDHPVREMQDTFFLDKKTKLPEKKIVDAVRKSHEHGVAGSLGWNYKWSEEESRRMVLRTHTTCLSALTLAHLKKNDLPAKFFAIGKCFRNETIDWSHGFEFNQTEGIVVDKNANFRHLLGYLRQFFKKMGFEKIRFSPAYFPYTEPSVEINFWHPEKKCWLELGGAGMFRPEVIIPLLGEYIPVLAWGPGFDRILIDYYGIKDLRELYKNNLTQLRKIKFWMKG